MLKTITHIVASIVQGYAMKLFCLLLIVVPFATYALGWCDLVKHGLLAMLYLAVVLAITPFFLSRDAIEQAVDEIKKLNEQE